MKKIMIMSECPRCHSERTGRICVRQGFSLKWEQKSILNDLNNAEFIKYVNPEEYRNYYQRFGINGYCEDCGYEFRGNLEKIKLPTEEFNNYKKIMTLKKINTLIKPIKKKKKNKNFIKTVFYRFNILKGKEINE